MYKRQEHDTRNGRILEIYGPHPEDQGIKIDEEKNKTKGDIVDLTAEGAAVKTFIICTNEELMIARDTKALVEVDAMMHTKKVAEPEA